MFYIPLLNAVACGELSSELQNEPMGYEVIEHSMEGYRRPFYGLWVLLKKILSICLDMLKRTGSLPSYR